MTVTQQAFRGPRVCQIVGITFRQLDYWARTNLLRPSIADARGSGSQRLYSRQDLVALKVVKRLIDNGVSLYRARDAIEPLAAVTDYHDTYLVLQGHQATVTTGSSEIVRLMQNGGGIVNVLALEPIVTELDHQLLEATA